MTNAATPFGWDGHHSNALWRIRRGGNATIGIPRGTVDEYRADATRDVLPLVKRQARLMKAFVISLLALIPALSLIGPELGQFLTGGGGGDRTLRYDIGLAITILVLALLGALRFLRVLTDGKRVSASKQLNERALFMVEMTDPVDASSLVFALGRITDDMKEGIFRLADNGNRGAAEKALETLVNDAEAERRSQDERMASEVLRRASGSQDGS